MNPLKTAEPVSDATFSPAESAALAAAMHTGEGDALEEALSFIGDVLDQAWSYLNDHSTVESAGLDGQLHRARQMVRAVPLLAAAERKKADAPAAIVRHARRLARMLEGAEESSPPATMLLGPEPAAALRALAAAVAMMGVGTD